MLKQQFTILAVLLIILIINVIAEDNPYKILGVRRNADDKTIKRAFKKLSIKYHPDKNPDPAANQYYAKVTNAYETLKDPENRRNFDMFGSQGQQMGRQQQQRGRGFDNEDVFTFHFGNGNFQQGGHGRRGRGQQQQQQYYRQQQQRKYNQQNVGNDDEGWMMDIFNNSYLAIFILIAVVIGMNVLQPQNDPEQQNQGNGFNQEFQRQQQEHQKAH